MLEIVKPVAVVEVCRFAGVKENTAVEFDPVRWATKRTSVVPHFLNPISPSGCRLDSS